MRTILTVLKGLSTFVSVCVCLRMRREGFNMCMHMFADFYVVNLIDSLKYLCKFRSKMGKAILSQPACVSKLLSLLLDQR